MVRISVGSGFCEGKAVQMVRMYYARVYIYIYVCIYGARVCINV